MSSVTPTISMNKVRQLSNPRRLNAAGLVVTSAAMLLQIATGSKLYPSVTGPIVLVLTALLVVFFASRWTAYAGLVVPSVLGIGAFVAAVMTGGFVDQLTDFGNLGLVAGSLLHVLGLTAAIGGGVAMVLSGRGPAERER